MCAGSTREVCVHVKSGVASAVCDSVAAGRARDVGWTFQSCLRNGAPREVEVRGTERALRVEGVVAAVRPAGVVGVGRRPARLAVLADHVARRVALVLHLSVAGFS